MNVNTTYQKCQFKECHNTGLGCGLSGYISGQLAITQEGSDDRIPERNANRRHKRIALAGNLLSKRCDEIRTGSHHGKKLCLIGMAFQSLV
jgi:hypothetical protein